MADRLDGGSIYKGSVTSIHDAELCAEGEQDTASKDTSIGSALWEYRNMHTLDGIPIQEEWQNLPIDSDNILRGAMQLVKTAKSKLFCLTPGDCPDNEEYTEILQKQASGEVIITNETKNFDATTASYVVWVTYLELSYVLHPRYSFLSTEMKEL